MTETETIIVRESDAPEKVEYFDPWEQNADFLKGLQGFSTNARRRINKAASEVVAHSNSAEDRYYAANGYGLFGVATPPYNMDELASFYDTSPTNHAAIVAKVSSVVGLGYGFEPTIGALDKLQSLEEEALKKAQRKIDRAKVDTDSWLDTLNKQDTFQRVLEKVATDYETTGNGYIEIGRTVTGAIGYVGHVSATTIRVRNRRDGFVQIVGQFVTFFNNFGESGPSPITNDVRPNELIHLKKYSPKSTFYGIPDSVSCSTAIVGDALAAKYNLDYFENAATPRYIVTLTGAKLSRTSEDRLFKFLQTSLRGNPHRTLFIPLPTSVDGKAAELKMEQVDNTNNDGSWENYRDRNKQDILIAHSVPESRIGGGTNNGTASSLASDRMFKEQVVVPNQRVFEKAISNIIAERTDIIKFSLNELSLTDDLAQSQIDERLIRNGIVTANEVRRGRGMPAHPDGDKLFDLNAANNLKAEQNAQANESRQRDQQRTANNSDSPTTVAGRNAKGEGRKQP